MHRAAAETMPTTIPVVLLDSRITSEAPGGTLLIPGTVGRALGMVRNMGWVMYGPRGFVPSMTKDVGSGSSTMSGWGLISRLFIFPAGILGAVSDVMGDAAELLKSGRGGTAVVLPASEALLGLKSFTSHLGARAL